MNKESRALEKMERIARNLPTPKTQLGRVDTNRGDIYIAWGRNVESWHGVFGVDVMGGVAVTVETPLETKDGASISEADFKQHLVNKGYETIAQFRNYGLSGETSIVD